MLSRSKLPTTFGTAALLTVLAGTPILLASGCGDDSIIPPLVCCNVGGVEMALTSTRCGELSGMEIDTVARGRACGGARLDAGPPVDAGALDAGSLDAGPDDASALPDAGPTEDATVDAPATDGGDLDGALEDASADGGAPPADAGIVDSSVSG